MSELAANARQPQTIHIKPTQGWSVLGLGELWQYREVIFYLAWRDVKVRYKQTIFGPAWAILQPFLTMIIFSIIFGKVAKLPSDGIPYPIFSYCALVPWTFFSSSITKGSQSLVASGSMLRQIYIPRFAMPLSSIGASVLDFLLAFSVLLLMMWFYNIMPTGNIVFLPFLLLLALTTALGVSLVLAAMNVQFRDIGQILPFLVQSWMYATPVVYPASVIESPTMQLVYALNPMVGVIEGFRWALLGTANAPGPMIAVSTTVAFLLLVFGAFYFKRMERTFADVV